MPKHVRATRVFAALASTMFTALMIVPVTPAAAAPAHALIQGTGSSWSANAVNQWISDVTSSGLQVVFTGNGSAQGRKDFANRTTDFAVSDIGYQGNDAITGAEDRPCFEGTNNCRAFAYEPIVAGGTSFPYQIRVAGKLVRNLRLSGETLAKIFTYQIRNWNDAQITRDNNGRQLPSIPIVPVVHAEGSGSTAQFTTYLDRQYPDIWRPFAKGSGFTEYYPAPTGGQGIAQTNSDGVMNFVTSKAANGAIGYDEYSYPLAKGWPVAKIKNFAGYYVLPDQYNVAVALQHAKINMDKSSPNYLLQDLTNVYVAPEVQAYPLSSYSYFLIPTASDDPRMTTAKRQTLADLLYYSVCQGQKEIGPIGYSPLPINLVQASFAQTAKLKAADPNVDLTKRDVTTCQNPTFIAGKPNENHLAKIAPKPAACDKDGAGPCNPDGSAPAGGTAGGTAGGGSGGGSTSAGGSGGGGRTGTGGGTTTSGAGSGRTATGNGSSGAAAGGTTVINPDTGQVQTVGGDSSGAAADLVGTPTELTAYRQPNMTGFLAPLAVAELIAVLAVPPLFYNLVIRRRRSGS